MSTPSQLSLKVFAGSDPVVSYEFSDGVEALEVVIKLHLLGGRSVLKFSTELSAEARSQLDFGDIQSLNRETEEPLSFLRLPGEIVKTLTLLRSELWEISMILGRQLRSKHFSSALDKALYLESISLKNDVKIIPERAMNKLKHLDSKVRSSLFAIQQILIVCQYAEKMQHKVSLSWLG